MRRMAMLALVLGAATVAGAAPASGGPWTRYANDPEHYSMGWSTAHWIPVLNRMLVWGGHSHNYRGNNSLRLFDPAANRWEVVYPNSNGDEGVQNRDNHVSFYVPPRGPQGEFWVIGGAYSSGSPCPGEPNNKCPRGKNLGGRFDLATRKWVVVANSKEEFGRGLIRDFQGFKSEVFPSSRGWCEAIDTGVIFGGAATNLLQIIEPNPGGTEPYRFWSGTPSGPAPRGQAQNNGLCLGDTFYIYGGTAPKYESMRDFWKLDVRAKRWTRLPDAPAAMYQPVMTHDPRQDVLVLHGGSATAEVLVYDLKAGRWDDLTPVLRQAGEEPRALRNQAGVYSPAVDQHIYTGGATLGKAGRASHVTEGLSLSALNAPAGPGRPSGGPAVDPRPSALARPAEGMPPARPAGVSREDAPSIDGPGSDRNGLPGVALVSAPQATAVAQAGDAGGRPGSGGAPAPGPPAARSAPETSRRIDIPLRTFVARKLPGYGKSPWGPMKHMRLAHNPVDGRIYFLGGDYSGPGGMQSYRNEMYSYSIAEDDWRQEQPYCRPPGEPQPQHPDEIGWAFDTRRHIFWMVPGFMGGTPGTCPESKQVRGRIMTFDPVTRAWDVPARKLHSPSTTGMKTFVQYDPETDSLIRFGSGAEVEIYDIEKDKWTVRKNRSGARLGYEYSAMDLKNRRIYIISPLESKLYVYNMNSGSLSQAGDTPPVNARPGFTRPVWDSISEVLIWFQFQSGERTGKLHVYDPRTKQWEQDLPLVQPDGLAVRGNNVVFDPLQNVMLLMGGTTDPQPYFFLYRHGDGRGAGG